MRNGAPVHALSANEESILQFYGEASRSSIEEWFAKSATETFAVQPKVNLIYSSAENPCPDRMPLDTYDTLPIRVYADSDEYARDNPGNTTNGSYFHQWRTIRMNDALIARTYPEAQETRKRKSLCHEIGHAFGLAHNDGVPSVMKTNSSDYGIQQSSDGATLSKIIAYHREAYSRIHACYCEEHNALCKENIASSAP